MRIASLAGAAVVYAAALLAPALAHAQLPRDPAERARVIAQILEANARQLTLFDRASSREIAWNGLSVTAIAGTTARTRCSEPYGGLASMRVTGRRSSTGTLATSYLTVTASGGSAHGWKMSASSDTV